MYFKLNGSNIFEAERTPEQVKKTWPNILLIFIIFVWTNHKLRGFYISLDVRKEIPKSTRNFPWFGKGKVDMLCAKRLCKLRSEIPLIKFFMKFVRLTFCIIGFGFGWVYNFSPLYSILRGNCHIPSIGIFVKYLIEWINIKLFESWSSKIIAVKPASKPPGSFF